MWPPNPFSEGMAVQDISLPKGYELDFYEQLDSTNSEALRQAAMGKAQGLWVWALLQGEGRGRLARRWESLAGNLFASLLLRPDCMAMTATQLGFVGGLALHDTVKGLAGEVAEPIIALKWPNDLLCDTRKTGGILLESTSDKSGAIAVVMGIGLNLCAHPQETEYPATDLTQHGIMATPAQALESLAQACDNWLGVWDNGAGFEDIRAAWMDRSLPANAPLEVKLAHERLQGAYRGIDKDGALMLALGDGGERRITTGDIFPL